MPSTTISLSSDQNNACKSFLNFLMSDRQEFYLFGAAGCGKTFLTQYFITHILKKYKNMCKVLGKKFSYTSVYLTATTNKAVEVLRQSFKGNNSLEDIQTIYKLFGVTVNNNYRTGETYLTQQQKGTFYDSIIIVDECSMLPSRMLKIIRSRVKNCKILFVGDSYQLPPVNEKSHWDHTPKQDTIYLNIPIRNQNSPKLISLCNQFRETVETGIFKDIKVDGKEIIHASDSDVLAWLSHRNNETTKVLSYTNIRTLQYIDYCHRMIHPNQPYFIVGNSYINNSNFELASGTRFYAEESVKLLSISGRKTYSIPGSSNTWSGYYAKVASCSRPQISFVYVMADPKEIKSLLAQEGAKKNWIGYFYLKNNIMDLRSIYACTVHKAQGSTYDEVLIDLDSFENCKNNSTVARLLYVAVTRARNKVIFYGSLDPKYGRLIHVN